MEGGNLTGSNELVIIAPTRGRNVVEACDACTCTPSDHRPYEGSQLVERRRLQLLDQVIIAPTRGRNLNRWKVWQKYVRVIIAPTRGRNVVKVAKLVLAP